MSDAAIARRLSAIEQKSPPLEVIQPNKGDFLTINPSRYYSSEEKEREWNKLWISVWLCAGRVSDIPDVGSWLRFDIGSESIIISRSAVDKFSAVYNVCQHRGSPLVFEEFGKNPAFKCKYHSWVYDLSGKCKTVTDRKSFDVRALHGDLDLGKLRCEAYAGWIWVSMDENAIPLPEYLGEMADIIDSYKMESMIVARDVRIALNCNWKVILDAFSESYHVHGIHPQAMPAANDRDIQNDFFPHGHSRQWVPVGGPSPRLAKQDQPNEVQKYMLADVGVDPDKFEGTSNDVRRAIQLAKRQPKNSFGLDYSHLTDNQLTDVWALNIFPCMQFNSTAEGIGVLRYFPHASDPQQCVFHYMALVPKMKPGKNAPTYFGVPEDADLSGNVRPKRIYTSWNDPKLDTILSELYLQDVDIVGKVQAGLRSRGLRKVRFSEQEQRNQHQFAEIERYLNG